MDTFKFKTNIDSSESIEKVRLALDNDKKIQYWHVDILKEDHVLTVTGENLKQIDIKDKINQAGFQLEEV
jgi:hypothetical protein